MNYQHIQHFVDGQRGENTPKVRNPSHRHPNNVDQVNQFTNRHDACIRNEVRTLHSICNGHQQRSRKTSHINGDVTREWGDLRNKIASKLSEPGPFGRPSFVNQKQSHAIFTDKYSYGRSDNGVPAMQDRHCNQNDQSGKLNTHHTYRQVDLLNVEGIHRVDRKRKMNQTVGRFSEKQRFDGDCPWQALQYSDEQKRAFVSLLG